jgi:PHD/YefM family antitoxin component YafN of YafNO toxin-antitoxin module
MRIEVLSVREAREQLPSLLERFRNGDRTPVFLGSHRKTEAVMIPADVYNEITSRDNAAAQAYASLRAEGMVVSDRVKIIIDHWIHGDIDTDEMERQVKAVHGIR